ncbi:MAG TPA: glycosyltransferase [Aeromicrobium sp.]|nr:glycosyltransferase [Aeromicrobium sp.]
MPTSETLVAAVVATGALSSILALEVIVGRRRLARAERAAKAARALAKKNARSLKAANRRLKEVESGLAAGAGSSLMDRGDVLEAYALLTKADALRAMTWEKLRGLRDALFGRGYLTAALDVATVLAELSRASWHEDTRDALAANIRVLTGQFWPTLRTESLAGTHPNRVLHVVKHVIVEYENGYTIRTHNAARAQVAAGLDVQVVSLLGTDNPGAEPPSTVVDGVLYRRSPGPARGSDHFDRWLQANVEYVAGIVREARPAVLHAASDFAIAMTAEAVGRAFDIPVVYESRGFWEETWLSLHAQTYGWTDIDRLEAEFGLPDAYLWRRDIENECRRRADRVVALDDVMADRIIAGGVLPEHLAVVPNAVDVEQFPVLTRDRALAEQLNISPTTTVVGYISSIVEYEGIDTLISAFARMSKTATAPVALLIVGDGPELDNLRHLAADEGLGPAEAIFTGRVPHDDVLRYYSLIDVFVVPRKPVEVCHLVTPLKPFEAFSTGRTVVLSNVRALAGIAKQSQSAELFEAGDPVSLADVLADLIANPERRQELADAGTRWVRAERTWQHNAELYVKLYRELGVVLTPAQP